MRCQGPRKVKQETVLKSSPYMPLVQQRQPCKTSVSLPALVTNTRYSDSLSVIMKFHQNSVAGQNLVPFCSVFYPGSVSEE